MQDSILSFDSFRPGSEHVATLMPADRVFSPQKATFRVPAGWMVLAGRTGGDVLLYEAGSTVESADVVDLLLARTSPVHLELAEDDLPSADDHPCDVHVRLWVRLSHDPGDLRSFRMTVLASRDVADPETIRRYLSMHCRRAIAQFARQHRATELVDGERDDAAAAILEERLRPALYAGGLAIYQPPVIRFECEQIDPGRGDASAAGRQQLRTALLQARHRRLSEVEALLRQLQVRSEASPDVAVADLIGTTPAPQRHRIYDSLWALMPSRDRTQWIVVAAGNRLMCFDPNLPDAPAREAAFDGSPGMLRSVRPHRQADGDLVLLLGAARGVYRVGAEDLRVRSTHTFTPASHRELRGGVNAAAVWQNRLFATHSEAGLLAWDIGGHGEAQHLLGEFTRNARTVRRAQVVGRRLVFAVDDRILVCPVDSPVASLTRTYRGGRGRITALHAVQDDIVAGSDVGDVWHWPMSEPNKARRLRIGDGSPVESAKQIAIGGVPFIVFSEKGSPALQVLCRSDSSYLGRFPANEFALRRCAIAHDMLIAMTETRDRLIVWRPAESIEPAVMINVAAQAGFAIQDVWLVTEPIAGA